VNEAPAIAIARATAENMQPLPSAADAAAQLLSSRIAAGDEAAMQELYDDYAPRLRRFVLALSRGDETLADEIAQAAMLTAAGKLRRVESEAHLWNWLARVARQHLGKAWRKQRRDQSLLPLDGRTEIAAEAAAERKLETALERAMKTLEADEQTLLHLFYEDRMSQQDIASHLGTTAKAVAGRLDRLREKLRKKISEGLRDEND
jgi:RNA polymerase sigma-70 factor (ECF subfamily)